jgi:hypothetical protein
MNAISVREFGKLLGSYAVSGMAQKVGLKWPPPPPISIRNIAHIAGIPLTPTNLQLVWIVGNSVTMHPPDSHDVPLNTGFSWADPGNNTARQAQSWMLHTDYFDKQLNSHVSFDYNTSYPGYNLTPSQYLKPGTDYVWQVQSINQYGRSPYSTYYDFITASGKPSPPPPPPPQPPPPKTGFAKVRIYNCNADHREIHIWVNDYTAQTGFQEQDTLPDQYEGGICPGESAEPSEITLEDGHFYEIVCVDPGLPACDENDPINGACRRLDLAYEGKSGGETDTINVP